MNHNKHTAPVWYGLKLLHGEIVAAKHFPFEPLKIDFNLKLNKRQAAESEVVRVTAPVEPGVTMPTDHPPSELPEALRLAERIHPQTDWYEFDQQTWCNAAAAELRKLHAECEALREVSLARLRRLQRIARDCSDPVTTDLLDAFILSARTKDHP